MSEVKLETAGCSWSGSAGSSPADPILGNPIGGRLGGVPPNPTPSLDTIRTSRHLPSVEPHAFIRLFCTSCGKTWEHQIDCGDRTCPDCNLARKKRIFSRYEPVIKKFRRPKLVTLTTRRTVLSWTNVKRLRDWFTRLRHRKVWTAQGGLYQIELGTIDDLGMCNLHIHALVDSDYMHQGALSEAWRDITGSYIVDIQECYNSKGALNYLTLHMGKVIAGPEFSDMVNSALKNTRLVQGFGVLDCDDLDIRDPVCPYCHAIGSVITQYEPLVYDCIGLIIDKG